MKAAIASSGNSGGQQLRQKAASAQSSPGASRSTSPHQLQQQIRRRSANYAMETQDAEEEEEPLPAGYRRLPGPSGLPRMSQQQQCHRSQPQLSPQPHLGGVVTQGGSKLLYGSHQQLSRGSRLVVGPGSHQPQQQRNAQLVQAYANRPHAGEAAGDRIPRSFGLPAPGFASSRPGGSSSYVQKSM